MAFLMAALTRSKSGAYQARKGIPKDVREEYAALYGPGWEAKLTLDASLTPAQAKRRHSEWLADVESRIEAIRARGKGQHQSLTQRQIQALAGEWYQQFVARYEENPGSPETWEARFWLLISRLEEFAPETLVHQENKNLDWLLRDPQVRASIRSDIALESTAAQFLTNKGLSLSRDAEEQFLDCILVEYAAALLLLERRARGDFSPDERLEGFPSFQALPVRPPKASELTPWQLFEAWVEAKNPALATIDRWRSVFISLNEHVKGPAASITADEAQRWIEGLITERRSAATVSDVWHNALRTVWGWGVRTRKLGENPFLKVHVAVPRKARIRLKAFTPEEATTILGAASRFDKPKRPFDAARRWVPWVCAYTGARAGEITQLRGRDVSQQEGHWVINITPEAGTVKVREARTVPIHQHLIEQGFITFVKSRGDGPLFYDAKSAKKSAGDDPTNPPKLRSVRMRERIAEWVRVIGVKDKNVQPNHAWRHTFKQIAARVGIEDKLSDYITGHSPASVARMYGEPTVSDKAAALRKFPKYPIK